MSTQLDNEITARPPAPPIDDEFPMPSKSRRVLRGLAWAGALLLAAAGIAFFIYRRAHAVPVVHYETSAIDRGTIAAKVTATGTLSALLTVQVGTVAASFQAPTLFVRSPKRPSNRRAGTKTPARHVRSR